MKSTAELSRDKFITDKYHDMLSENEAKFILDHGEKVLKDTLDSNSMVMSRMSSVMSLASAAFLGLWGYVLNKLTDSKVDTAIMLAAFSGIAVLAWVLI